VHRRQGDVEARNASGFEEIDEPDDGVGEPIRRGRRGITVTSAQPGAGFRGEARRSSPYPLTAPVSAAT
jgi:hypothetical protein